MIRPLKVTPIITEWKDASLIMFLKEVNKLPLLTINEEIQLSQRIQQGDEAALNKLIEGNIRFVITVAKQYQNNGVPLVDLIQEGLIGLARAARSYDESKGARFISYAVWWIRQAILQALTDQCRTIRVPSNQIVAIGKINKVIEQFEQENNRQPSDEELSEQTKYSTNQIQSTITGVKKAVSLDTPFEEGESSSLLDVVPDTSFNTEQSEISKNMYDILDQLPDREHDLILMYFGFGMAPMQIEEISSRFGISCVRTGQALKEALQRLKDNFKDELLDILDLINK